VVLLIYLNAAPQSAAFAQHSSRKLGQEKKAGDALKKAMKSWAATGSMANP
jgi:hypothetical protein